MRETCSLCGTSALAPEDAAAGCNGHLSTWDRDSIELGSNVAEALYFQNVPFEI